MIKEIDIRKREEAEAVLEIQIPAYEVEADWVGSYELPPLKDTVERLQKSGENFHVYYEDEVLRGAISVNIEGDELVINRLFVHPDSFNKGIAKSLLDYIEDKYIVETIKVSTGADNTPAINFYRKNGFAKIEEKEVEDQLWLSLFEKKVSYYEKVPEVKF